MKDDIREQHIDRLRKVKERGFKWTYNSAWSAMELQNEGCGRVGWVQPSPVRIGLEAWVNKGPGVNVMIEVPPVSILRAFGVVEDWITEQIEEAEEEG